MTKTVVVCLVFLGCLSLAVSVCNASMYDTGDQPSVQQTNPPRTPCASPGPVLYGPHPYGRYMIFYPRGYGTYLDDTRRGIQYFDISGGAS